MIKKIAVVLIGTVFLVACSQQSSPSSPSSSSTPADNSTVPDGTSGYLSTSTVAALSQKNQRVGFGVNATVSGFPTGVVFVSGGGSYDRAAGSAKAGGGFTCVEPVLQGPLSTSINVEDPGPCLKNQGIRWDTAALLASTTFKCNAAASDRTAVTSDNTVVLQGDFYRAGNGNEESFTAKMIVTEGDLAPDLPGLNVWVQGVGCGTARAVNFSR